MKKIIFIMSCVLIATITFSGCGSSGESSETSETEATTAAPTTKDTMSDEDFWGGDVPSKSSSSSSSKSSSYSSDYTYEDSYDDYSTELTMYEAVDSSETQEMMNGFSSTDDKISWNYYATSDNTLVIEETLVTIDAVQPSGKNYIDMIRNKMLGSTTVFTDEFAKDFAEQFDNIRGSSDSVVKIKLYTNDGYLVTEADSRNA